MNFTNSRKILSLILVGLGLWVVFIFYLYRLDRKDAHDELLQVVQAYLKASYAHNFKEAYRYLSLDDQKIRSKDDYAREKGSYDGFMLELASYLAEGMEIGVLARDQSADRARLQVRFKFPAPEDLSPVVSNWEANKLNSLSRAQQQRLLEILDELKRDGKLALVEGQETFGLIKEGSDWRLFFDWASGVKVAFGFWAPASSGIEVEFSERHTITKTGEPFQIGFKIKNRSSREVSVRIDHLVEPSAVREHLEMIQCGLLSTITLAPRSEQEMASVYLLTGQFPENVKDVTITYGFNAQKSPARAAFDSN